MAKTIEAAEQSNFFPGDVVMADLGRVPDHKKVDHEQAGYRPVLVVSNGDTLKGNQLLTVVPITSTPQTYPLTVDLSDYEVEHTQGTILVNQMRTIDKNAHGEIYLRERLTDVRILEKVKELMKLWLDME